MSVTNKKKFKSKYLSKFSSEIPVDETDLQKLFAVNDIEFTNISVTKEEMMKGWCVNIKLNKH